MCLVDYAIFRVDIGHEGWLLPDTAVRKNSVSARDMERRRVIRAQCDGWRRLNISFQTAAARQRSDRAIPDHLSNPYSSHVIRFGQGVAQREDSEDFMPEVCRLVSLPVEPEWGRLVIDG